MGRDLLACKRFYTIEETSSVKQANVLRAYCSNMYTVPAKNIIATKAKMSPTTAFSAFSFSVRILTRT